MSMEHSWQDLLMYLYADGLKWYRNLPGDDWRRELVPHHGRLTDLNLQLMLDDWAIQNHVKGTSAPDHPGLKKAFVVQPCKHAEKSLTMLAPFILTDGANARLSLQLGILDRPGGTPRFFGYRFESPEAHEEHKFHHVQPVQAFGHGASLSMSATWYPSRYPSFPLASANTAELVAAVLVSIRESPTLKALTAPASRIPHEARQVMSRFLEKICPTA